MHYYLTLAPTPWSKITLRSRIVSTSTAPLSWKVVPCQWQCTLRPPPLPFSLDQEKTTHYCISDRQQLSCSPWAPGVCHSWPLPPPSWPPQADHHHCLGNICGSSWAQFEPAMWQDQSLWSACCCKQNADNSTPPFCNLGGIYMYKLAWTANTPTRVLFLTKEQT